MFSSYGYDSVTFVNNAYFVYAKFTDNDGHYHDYAINPTIYYLDSQDKLTKINKRDGFYPDGYDLTYSYTDTVITESAHGSASRNFYMENKNLVKVLLWRYSPPGVISWKKEILFQDYDNKPNPFKNKYYVAGAFFRSFSENNYTTLMVNEYGLLADSTFGIIKTFRSTIPFAYTDDGYPKFGDYE